MSLHVVEAADTQDGPWEAVSAPMQRTDAVFAAQRARLYWLDDEGTPTSERYYRVVPVDLAAR